MFKLNTLLAALMVVGLVGAPEYSEAAFGGSRASSSSVGVSRSASRPSAPSSSSYSRPSTPSSSSSYSRPAVSAPSTSSYRNNTPPPSQNYSNNRSNYNNNQGYNNNSYQQPQRNSAMRDIGVTAAGVGGGILAASAIQSLISSPNHPGMYTSPQNPGQYYNAQGVPQSAPVDQGQYQQQPQANYNQSAPMPYQQPQYQQPKEEGGGFFSFLWGVLGNILHLALYLAVVAGVGYGGYKAYRYLQGRYKQEMINNTFNPTEEKINLDNNAMEIFTDFQKNSDNKDWVTKNTKYMPVDECLSPASQVLSYEHQVIDCKVEQGKLRASVMYTATLKNSAGEENIKQYWNFEKDSGIWKVIGVEPV